MDVESAVEAVSQREFSRRVGCSHRAVQLALASGTIPIGAVLSDGRLDFRRALAAWVARDSRHDETTPRLAEVRARLLELEYQRQCGLLVSAAKVRAADWAIFRQVRDQFQNVPTRIATVVAGERDPARVHALIKAEIDAVLQGLSAWAKAQAETNQEGPPDDR